MHFNDRGRACLYRSLLVGRQDIHSGSRIVHFGNLVLADPQSFKENLAVFVCFKGNIIAVCSGNAESEAFHLSVRRCFYDFQVSTHRLVCEAFALRVFHLIGLTVRVDEYLVLAFVKSEALRRFAFFHKIASVEQIGHFILPDFLFGQCADQLVLAVQLAVIVGVLIDLKYSARQLRIGIFSVHLRKSDVATHQLIDDFNLNDLLIL